MYFEVRETQSNWVTGPTGTQSPPVGEWNWCIPRSEASLLYISFVYSQSPIYLYSRVCQSILYLSDSAYFSQHDRSSTSLTSDWKSDGFNITSSVVSWVTVTITGTITITHDRDRERFKITVNAIVIKKGIRGRDFDRDHVMHFNHNYLLHNITFHE